MSSDTVFFFTGPIAARCFCITISVLLSIIIDTRPFASKTVTDCFSFTLSVSQVAMPHLQHGFL